MLKPSYTKKPLLMFFTFLLFLSWSNFLLAHDEAKIAVVDLDLIVVNSLAGKNLQTKLEQFQKTTQAEVEIKQNEAQQIRQRIADGSNSLSQEQLGELQKQFEGFQVNLKRFIDDKQRQGQKMQAEGLKQVEASLEPVFEKIKADNNYDLILNRVPGVVVMASDKVDITNKVIELLNNEL